MKREILKVWSHAFNQGISTLSPDDANVITAFQVAPPVVKHELVCEQELLSFQFGNSYGTPFVGTFTPKCTGFDQVVLVFYSNVTGRQFDRVGALWVGGSEIYRYTTQEPSGKSITQWTFEKDVSTYAALFSKQQSVVLSLDNVKNDVYTGVFNVTIHLKFYKNSANDNPNMIIPLSASNSSYGWFSLPSGNSPVNVKIPPLPSNIRKAQVQLFVSGHGQDEFWYSNVPNNLSYPDNGLFGNGCFKEVQLFIDDKLVSVEWPSPTIYTGGINPLHWRPIVAINAFDVPTMDFDIEPYLSLLYNGSHTIGFNVSTAANPYWPIDGNLLLWLDGEPEYQPFQGELTRLEISPQLPQEISRGDLNTIANIETTLKKTVIASGRRMTRNGWKVSTIKKTLYFENYLVLRDAGNDAVWNQTTTIEYEHDKYSRKSKYPLSAHVIATNEGNKTRYDTSIQQGYFVETNDNGNQKLLTTTQESSGFFGGSKPGHAATSQEMFYKANTECYHRKVSASGGAVTSDQLFDC